MIATTKVKYLLDHLDDTKGLSGSQIQAKVNAVLADVQAVIFLFEQVCRSLPRTQRVSLAAHLWANHVAAPPCVACSFGSILSGWWAGISSTTLWRDWQGLAVGNPSKPPEWSAAKFLSIYLSLTTRGFTEEKALLMRCKDGRLHLTGGNNRVRILAAIGQFEVEVRVDAR